jgi:GAF domain-containing protein
VAASSGPTVQILELLEQQSEEGPCPDCYRSGEPLLDQTLADARDRWPHFAPGALEAGFRSVHALPLRFRGQAFGALNLYSVSKAPLQDSEVRAAQALADLATVTIVQHRALSEAQLLNDQLQHALNSRIAIEQAKGMIAGLHGVGMDTAFSLLRRYAHDNAMGLTAIAVDIVSGTLSGVEIDPRSSTASTTAPTG